MSQPAGTVLQTAYHLFQSKLDALREDGSRGLINEYRDVISLDTLASCKEAERKINATKNRYSNIIPFDYNRVKLSGKDDYINASLLQSEQDEQPSWSYVATQGPLPGTIADFWKMVCENKCRAVLMLTKTMEHRSVKCCDYFPVKLGGITEYGQYQVTTTDQQNVTDDVTCRILSVLNKQTQESSLVTHYHYHQWSDHGIPHDTMSIRVLSKVLEHTGAHASSIVVHCSAGVGRTGTFCTVDIVLRALRYLRQREDLPKTAELYRAMDVCAVVMQLRRQRKGMVQTLDQYSFCYQAVKEELQDLTRAAVKEANSGKLELKTLDCNTSETQGAR